MRSPVTTYEPEYNTVHQVVLDDQLALYEFEPHFVVLLTAVQAFRNSCSRPTSATAQVADREADQLVSRDRGPRRSTA